jgi:hypothetical protein
VATPAGRQKLAEALTGKDFAKLNAGQRTAILRQLAPLFAQIQEGRINPRVVLAGTNSPGKNELPPSAKGGFAKVGIDGTILIAAGLSDADLAEAAMHEFGEAIGSRAQSLLSGKSTQVALGEIGGRLRRALGPGATNVETNNKEPKTWLDADLYINGALAADEAKATLDGETVDVQLLAGVPPGVKTRIIPANGGGYRVYFDGARPPGVANFYDCPDGVKRGPIRWGKYDIFIDNPKGAAGATLSYNVRSAAVVYKFTKPVFPPGMWLEYRATPTSLWQTMKVGSPDITNVNGKIVELRVVTGTSLTSADRKYSAPVKYTWGSNYTFNSVVPGSGTYTVSFSRYPGLILSAKASKKAVIRSSLHFTPNDIINRINNAAARLRAKADDLASAKTLTQDVLNLFSAYIYNGGPGEEAAFLKKYGLTATQVAKVRQYLVIRDSSTLTPAQKKAQLTPLKQTADLRVQTSAFMNAILAKTIDQTKVGNALKAVALARHKAYLSYQHVDTKHKNWPKAKKALSVYNDAVNVFQQILPNGGAITTSLHSAITLDMQKHKTQMAPFTLVKQILTDFKKKKGGSIAADKLDSFFNQIQVLMNSPNLTQAQRNDLKTVYNSLNMFGLRPLAIYLRSVGSYNQLPAAQQKAVDAILNAASLAEDEAAPMLTPQQIDALKTRFQNTIRSAGAGWAGTAHLVSALHLSVPLLAIASVSTHIASWARQKTPLFSRDGLQNFTRLMATVMYGVGSSNNQYGDRNSLFRILTRSTQPSIDAVMAELRTNVGVLYGSDARVMAAFSEANQADIVARLKGMDLQGQQIQKGISAAEQAAGRAAALESVPYLFGCADIFVGFSQILDAIGGQGGQQRVALQAASGVLNMVAGVLSIAVLGNPAFMVGCAIITGIAYGLGVGAAYSGSAHKKPIPPAS